MNKAEYQKYLSSDHWKRTRRYAILNSGNRCQRCGISLALWSDINTSPLEAHHLTYERIWGERPDDLVVLCPICHEHIHSANFNPENEKQFRTILDQAADASKSMAMPMRCSE